MPSDKYKDLKQVAPQGLAEMAELEKRLMSEQWTEEPFDMNHQPIFEETDSGKISGKEMTLENTQTVVKHTGTNTIFSHNNMATKQSVGKRSVKMSGCKKHVSTVNVQLKSAESSSSRNEVSIHRESNCSKTAVAISHGDMDGKLESVNITVPLEKARAT